MAVMADPIANVFVEVALPSHAMMTARHDTDM